MPASEEFYKKLMERLRDEPSRQVQDKLLDLWLATTQMATEWDARQWGFDPEKWMVEERYMLAQQGKVPRTVRKPSPE